jgi:hypothetical protein
MADPRELTDEEILTPGNLVFPNGGEICVHSISGLGDNAEVYFARRMPGSKEWECHRIRPVKSFLAGVRKAGGQRADPDPRAASTR